MRFLTWSFVALTLVLGGCQNTQSPSQSEPEKLAQVINNYHEFVKSSSPLNNAESGGDNARLPDLSADNLANKNQQLNAIYQSLLMIDSEQLDTEQQINFAVLSYRVKNDLDLYQFKSHYTPFTAESGFHAYISWISSSTKMTNEQDYQDYLARLTEMPRYFDQQMAWMEKGLAEGITQPKAVLKGYEQSIAAFIKEDVEQSTYYRPFNNMPAHLDDETKVALKAQAKSTIKNLVYPSYQKYYDFMVNEYIPNTRDNIAASAMPNGLAFYDNRVKHYTTLDISAQEVHEIGLKEVKRIRAEMQAIIDSVKFEGSFAEFVEFLRTDEQFYAKTPEDLLKEASFIAKKMDAKLPSLFKTLPRTPYGVIEVPANIAPKYTTGRYSGPSRDDQPGNYWVNTYRLDRRPLYVLEALTLHEAVPGHHLQGSIAREMKNVPKFRNQTYISAFGEGWGLYSEYLGIEAGFYQDPYSDFGRLTYEMWRAARLVVDTGMHQMGWTRQQAIDFLASNTALSLHNVTTEIDRYISWPGQALSYKIGELTIKRLRKDAEQRLGEHFDLREFHDEVLKNGSMPLSMLEQLIESYISQQEAKLSS
ncbi:DUF885 domain-containing protein [Thalassotalea eurytherma]|uniref:DUF885 domain-containing protein n=1 Tax=Thalassotalea eurytherma TaxID=1144278 RepID=A0ABQ6GZD8_9GAMM|nr:DUF885 domain-containing protein [Thalassotalea eurytherma]GLX80692.1 hypothetical protein theurythT_01440 [Thalassotalea eurytherma]